MDDLKKALDQMRGETRQSFADVAATMREQFEAVGSAIDQQQKALAAMQAANVEMHRAISRQTHVLDQSMAKASEDFDRHSENVGKIIYAYVDDLHALKAEVRGISSRVDALERGNPPAA